MTVNTNIAITAFILQYLLLQNHAIEWLDLLLREDTDELKEILSYVEILMAN